MAVDSMAEALNRLADSINTIAASRDAARRERDDLRHQRDAYEDALTDLAHIARGELEDPWVADEPKPDTVGGRAYAAVCDLVRERDDLRAQLADPQARLTREAELSQRVADLQGQLRDADATAAGLRAEIAQLRGAR